MADFSNIMSEHPNDKKMRLQIMMLRACDFNEELRIPFQRGDLDSFCGYKVGDKYRTPYRYEKYETKLVAKLKEFVKVFKTKKAKLKQEIPDEVFVESSIADMEKIIAENK